jgi:hypothetical protein
MKFLFQLMSIVFIKVLMIKICEFTVDFSSFYIQDQKDLHSSNMVQGSIFLSCKCSSKLLKLVVSA